MKEIRPWYRWFPLDYSRSRRVMSFSSLAIHGAYRNLLDAIWMWGGSIPNDRNILWKLALAPSRQDYDLVAEEVEAMLEKSDDGKSFTNKRIVQEWDEAGDFLEKKRRAGKASADAKRKRNTCSTSVEHQESTPSTSSSSSTEQKEKRGDFDSSFDGGERFKEMVSLYPKDRREYGRVTQDAYIGSVALIRKENSLDNLGAHNWLCDRIKHYAKTEKLPKSLTNFLNYQTWRNVTPATHEKSLTERMAERGML